MPEEKIGVITHYFGQIQVAAIKLDGELKVGDTIHVKGHTSDFTQTVASIQLEHASIPAGKKGDEVALKVVQHARQHDEVFRVTGE